MDKYDVIIIGERSAALALPRLDGYIWEKALPDPGAEVTR